MSFFACIDIALSLDSLSILENKALSHMCIQFTMYLEGQNIKYYATPYSIINQFQKNNGLRKSMIDTQFNYYATKLMKTKQIEKIAIQQICNFRLLIASQQNINSHNLVIICGLYNLQGQELIQIDEVILKTNKITPLANYLPILFKRNQYVCSLDAVIHSQITGYKFCLMTSEFKQIQAEPTSPQICMKDSLDRSNNHSSFLSYLSSITDNFLPDKLEEFYEKHMTIMKATLNKLKQRVPQYEDDDGQVESQSEKPNIRIRSKIFGDNNSKIIQNNLSAWASNLFNEINNLSGKIYELWNKQLKLKLYFAEIERLKNEYMNAKQKYYKANVYCNLDLKDSSKQLQLSFNKKQFNIGDLVYNPLKVIFFQKNLTEIPLELSEITEVQQQMTSSAIQILEQKTHVIVFVHGFNASRYAFDLFKVLLKYYFPDLHIFISICNQMRTDDHIQEMGRRFAQQLKQYIKKSKLDHFQITLVGHSLGGMIIRAALPYLNSLKENFKNFITIGTPHLGYLYHKNFLIKTGLWFINRVHKPTSMLMLNMEDKSDLRDTYLYQLSNKQGLSWFKQIILICSPQDLYISQESAHILKTSNSIQDAQKKIEKGQVYVEMVNNILFKTQNVKITRIKCHFLGLSVPLLDRLIGRTAHINYLVDEQFITLLYLGHKKWFI